MPSHFRFGLEIGELLLAHGVDIAGATLLPGDHIDDALHNLLAIYVPLVRLGLRPLGADAAAASNGNSQVAALMRHQIEQALSRQCSSAPPHTAPRVSRKYECYRRTTRITTTSEHAYRFSND